MTAPAAILLFLVLVIGSRFYEPDPSAARVAATSTTSTTVPQHRDDSKTNDASSWAWIPHVSLSKSSIWQILLFYGLPGGALALIGVELYKRAAFETIDETGRVKVPRRKLSFDERMELNRYAMATHRLDRTTPTDMHTLHNAPQPVENLASLSAEFPPCPSVPVLEQSGALRDDRLLLGYGPEGPVSIPIIDEETTSFGVLGKSGTGKTVFVTWLVYQLLRRPNTKVWIVDRHATKEQSLVGRLGANAQYCEVAQTWEIKRNGERAALRGPALVDAIHRFLDRMEAAYETDLDRATNPVLNVVIFEEWPALMRMDPKLKQRILRFAESLGEEGRKANWVGGFISQSWLVDDIGGSSTIRNLLGWCALFRTDDTNANKMTGLTADDLPDWASFKKGRLLVADPDGNVLLAQAPMLTDDDLTLLADKLYNSCEPVTVINIVREGPDTLTMPTHEILPTHYEPLPAELDDTPEDVDLVPISNPAGPVAAPPAPATKSMPTVLALPTGDKEQQIAELAETYYDRIIELSELEMNDTAIAEALWGTGKGSKARDVYGPAIRRARARHLAELKRQLAGGSTPQ